MAVKSRTSSGFVQFRFLREERGSVTLVSEHQLCCQIKRHGYEYVSPNVNPTHVTMRILQVTHRRPQQYGTRPKDNFGPTQQLQEVWKFGAMRAYV
jgi:hypothetical protein